MEIKHLAQYLAHSKYLSNDSNYYYYMQVQSYDKVNVNNCIGGENLMACIFQVSVFNAIYLVYRLIKHTKI